MAISVSYCTLLTLLCTILLEIVYWIASFVRCLFYHIISSFVQNNSIRVTSLFSMCLLHDALTENKMIIVKMEKLEKRKK